MDWKDAPVNTVDLDQIVRGEFAENFVRKDFLPSENVAIREAVEPKEKKAAKERQGLSSGRGKKVGKVTTPFRGRTRDKVAKYTGMSAGTLEKAKQVVKAAKQDPARLVKRW